MVTQFVNNGTDLEVLNKSYESMPLEQQEKLAKALKKDGLVLVDVQVNGKHGVYTRKQWKKASDVKKNEGKSSNQLKDVPQSILRAKIISDTIGAESLNEALEDANKKVSKVWSYDKGKGETEVYQVGNKLGATIFDGDKTTYFIADGSNPKTAVWTVLGNDSKNYEAMESWISQLKEGKEEKTEKQDSSNSYPDYVNKTNVGVPKAHSSSYFSEKKAIEFAKQLHDNGATNIEISSTKDGFNQTQYRVAWDKEEKKQSTQKNTDKSSANISQKDLDEATSFLGDKDKRSWYYVHTPQEFKSGSLKFGSTITMAIDDIMRPLTSKEKRDQVTVNTVVAYLQERYSKTGGVLGKITKDDLKDIQGNLDKYRDGKLWGVKYHNGKDSNGNVIGDNQAKTTKKVADTSKAKQNSSSDSSKITNIKPTKPTHGTYAAESNLMNDEGEIDQTYTGKINGEEVEIYRVGDKLLAAYVDDDGNEIFYTSSGKDPSKANWENIGEDYDKAGKHLISGLSKDSSNVSVPKTKADIQSMLASGKSRNDIIELAKKSGISWKENDHKDINWMRCCMALTKVPSASTTNTNSEYNPKNTTPPGRTKFNEVAKTLSEKTHPDDVNYLVNQVDDVSVIKKLNDLLGRVDNKEGYPIKGKEGIKYKDASPDVKKKFVGILKEYVKSK